ncbi:MAG: hypothetical protein MUP19_08055 [Candidatus Aminicenantes bacterium]|nr:hypothetical protein [Candidatus Aminicenantes bacterium]
MKKLSYRGVLYLSVAIITLRWLAKTSRILFRTPTWLEALDINLQDSGCHIYLM